MHDKIYSRLFLANREIVSICDMLFFLFSKASGLFDILSDEKIITGMVGPFWETVTLCTERPQSIYRSFVA